MRPIPFVVTLIALAAAAITRADFVVPTTVPPLGNLNTILRADGPRQYQQYLSAGQFTDLTNAIVVTGLQVRLPSNAPASWPTNPVSFGSYIVKLGVASPALVASGGVFDPGVSFQDNMVNAVTVYSGSLTVPALAFQPAISSLEIRFNVANYTLRPGDSLVVYVSHSTADQLGIGTPGFETVDPTSDPTSTSAVFCRDTTSSFWAANGGQNSAYSYNLVTDPRLINVSTRGRVETGADIMIGGFVITGSVPKKVLVRAIGPSLAAAGVANVLADPQLALFRGSTPIANNDNWQSGTAANTAAIQATGFPPGDPRESAILMTLQPGAYTAQVLGVGGSSGAALVEVYDVDTASAAILINISTRAKVQTGSDVTIAGFAVRGASQKVLIRGLGPSLTAAGVPNALADPNLVLYNANNQIVAYSNDWQDAGGANTGRIQGTGLAPTNPRESAILIILAEGNYTCVLSGVGSTTGVGLIEVYEVP